MNDNLAYTCLDELPEERIAGRLVAMAPATVNHNRVKGNIYGVFWMHLRGRTCEVLPDGTAVYLTETDYYIPDVMVVCDPEKIRPDGIHGAPDLVVEVLSPATARYDRGRKKELYERCGTREYWIVSPEEKSVEQYLLRDGAFALENIYSVYPDWMLARMRAAERARVITEFQCSLYDDFTIPLAELFVRVP